MPFTNGENVGPYRILANLGQGGVASVYKAYHPALDRLVAIKVLHPAFKEDPNFLERFQREARVIARLEHPNIVPVYDFSQQSDQHYLVMKYIEGETLKARLGRSPLSMEEGLKVVESVGGGLMHAHARGVLHRDVKPSNILLDNSGRIYLADFGLARIAAAGESTLSSDMLMGTPQYISPEQARGEKSLDARTDIYSFGVVLYEIVVGRVPFQADTPFSIIHDHIYSPLPLPSSINSRVPEQVERVLLKALAKDRNDRFEDVEQMVSAFRRAARGEDSGIINVPAVEDTAIGTSASAVSSYAQGKKAGSETKKKGLWWLWLAAGILITCISVFLLLGILAPGETAPLDPADESLEQPVLLDQQLDDGIAPDQETADYHREAEILADDAARLAENGMFIQAAEMYLQALGVPELPEDAVANYMEQLYKVLYLAAPAGDDVRFVLEDARGRFGGSRDLRPVELRMKLFMEGPDHILQEVDQAVRDDPEHLEMRLLHAEVMMQMNRELDFNEDIEFLLTRDFLPDWIQEQAESLEEKYYEIY